MDRFINTKSSRRSQRDGLTWRAPLDSRLRANNARSRRVAEGRDHPFRGFRALFYWPLPKKVIFARKRTIISRLARCRLLLGDFDSTRYHVVNSSDKLIVLSDLRGHVALGVQHRFVSHEPVAIVQMDGRFTFGYRYQLKHRDERRICLKVARDVFTA